MLPRTLPACVVLVLAALPISAQSWGVKTKEPVSGPPATLFRLSAGSIATVGPVNLAGTPIDVDGLAVSAAQMLYGFQLTSPTGGNSRLIRISTLDASASVVGPFLIGREIRGAAMTSAGRLLVLDAALDQVLEVDEATGAIVGSPVALTLSAAPFDLSNVADLVEIDSGELIVSSYNQFLSLHPATGVLTSLHLDTAVAPDGFGVAHAGLMWGADTGTANRLGAYDVLNHEDIFAYDRYGSFARTLAIANIVPSYNGGRGDLASVPAGCSQGMTYCTAKVNSLGCTPAIAASGTPSAGAGSGFVVKASQVLNNKSGILFYGTTGQQSAPFQAGTLCVKAPIKRTPAVNSGGNPPPNDCSGVFSLDMNLFAAGGLGGSPLPALTVAGTVVNCQWWGRDPGFAAPSNTTLSNGLQYTVCH